MQAASPWTTHPGSSHAGSMYKQEFSGVASVSAIQTVAYMGVPSGRNPGARAGSRGSHPPGRSRWGPHPDRNRPEPCRDASALLSFSLLRTWKVNQSPSGTFPVICRTRGPMDAASNQASLNIEIADAGWPKAINCSTPSARRATRSCKKPLHTTRSSQF